MNRESGEEEADMCRALKELKKEAEERGIEQGTKRMNELMQRLLAEGKQEELLRSATDMLFQQKLFQEYHI